VNNGIFSARSVAHPRDFLPAVEKFISRFEKWQSKVRFTILGLIFPEMNV
jgi:hypothetical protein